MCAEINLQPVGYLPPDGNYILKKRHNPEDVALYTSEQVLHCMKLARESEEDLQKEEICTKY